MIRSSTLWLSLFVILFAAALIAYSAYFALVTFDNGDILDRFEVLSSVPSPDGQSLAVVYRYQYAETSSEGISVWLQGTDEPVVGSDSGWPKGKPAFTIVNNSLLPEFRWLDSGGIEVITSPATIARQAEDASHCFWYGDRNQGKSVLCLHSDSVTALAETQAE